MYCVSYVLICQALDCHLRCSLVAGLHLLDGGDPSQLVVMFLELIVRAGDH